MLIIVIVIAIAIGVPVSSHANTHGAKEGTNRLCGLNVSSILVEAVLEYAGMHAIVGSIVGNHTTYTGPEPGIGICIGRCVLSNGECSISSHEAAHRVACKYDFDTAHAAAPARVCTNLTSGGVNKRLGLEGDALVGEPLDKVVYGSSETAAGIVGGVYEVLYVEARVGLAEHVAETVGELLERGLCRALEAVNEY